MKTWKLIVNEVHQQIHQVSGETLGDALYNFYNGNSNRVGDSVYVSDYGETGLRVSDVEGLDRSKLEDYLIDDYLGGIASIQPV